MYSGKTTNLGVIGYPIGHSLSPIVQNTGIQEAGLDYAYTAMPVEPEHLEEAILGLKALGFRGVNVTIPHKQQVMQYLDKIDEAALQIGAVNTIVNDGGYLTGYNTDYIGFLSAFSQHSFEPAGKTALVLGAGGAARAVVCGLCQSKIKHLILAVRNPAKAQELADKFADKTKITLCDWQDTQAMASYLGEADLIVNTTPLGMEPNIQAMPPIDLKLASTQAIVYDIIYTPGETLLLSTAKKLGMRTINGEAMLVGQGAEAFRLWSGHQLNEASMTKALHQALAQK